MADAAPDLANLPLNCPRCGRPMLYIHATPPDDDTVADRAAANDPTVYIYRCATHGLFEFGANIAVRPRS